MYCCSICRWPCNLRERIPTRRPSKEPDYSVPCISQSEGYRVRGEELSRGERVIRSALRGWRRGFDGGRRWRQTLPRRGLTCALNADPLTSLLHIRSTMASQNARCADARSCPLMQSRESSRGIETSSLCIIEAYTSSNSTSWSARCWETLAWYWRAMRRVRCPRGGVGWMWSWSGQRVWSHTARPSAVVASRRHQAFRTGIAKSFAGTAHANTGCGMVCW